MTVDCAIIGGGIVGLSVAMVLGRRQQGLKILVVEKEAELALHQTGHNSGVIHSGIYYRPGSLKARFATSGNRSMAEFCEDHEIPHDVCDKVIVVTEQKELSLLKNLYNRGLANGLEVSEISKEEVQEIEPHVRCLRGIKVPATGIVSFRSVCMKYRELIRLQGGWVKTGTRIEAIRRQGSVHILETTGGTIEARIPD